MKKLIISQIVALIIITWSIPALAGKPIVEDSSAQDVTANSATLGAYIDTNGTVPTTVQLEYGTTAAYDTLVDAPTSLTLDSRWPVGFPVTNLKPGQTYHFRLNATNADGTTNGTDTTFTTEPLAPTAETHPATSVTGNSATLNGTVNANGAETTVVFLYGPNPGYGSEKTAVQSPVSENTDTAVSAVLDNLSPGTTYYFALRVSSSASGGPIETFGRTFTTEAGPPTISVIDDAAGIGTTTATFSGGVNPKNAETKVVFEYGPTTSYGSQIEAVQSPLPAQAFTLGASAEATGLTPNQFYNFRIKATNGAGTAYSANKTFTTSKAPPTATTGDAEAGSNIALLNGTVNANNDPTTVIFEYGLDDSYGSVIAAIPSPVSGTTSTDVYAIVEGLKAVTTYHYRVRTQNSASDQPTLGTDKTFMTSAGAPSAQTDPVGTVTATTAGLNGSVNPNGSDTTVVFQYGTDTSYGSEINAVQTPLTTNLTINQPVSATLGGLTPNTTYHYRVSSTSTGGTTFGGDQTFTTSTAPPTATTRAADPVASNSATLRGTVNANNDSTTVTFEYGTNTGYGNQISAAQSPVSGNTDTAISAVLDNLSPGTTYHYRVKAQNSASAQPTLGTDKTFTTGFGAPTAQTLPTGTVTATTTELNGSVNPNGSDTTVVFQYGTDTSYGSEINAVQTPLTTNLTINQPVSATLGGLTPNTTYHYRVSSTSTGGTTFGGDQTFTTSTAPPTATTRAADPVASNSATLRGTVNANNDSTTVTFEYGTNTGYGNQISAAQSPVSGNTDTAISAVLDNLSPGTTYHYRVKAQNSASAQPTLGTDKTFRTLTTSIAPPTVTTGDATPSSNSAAVNGSANANGASTTVVFEYGTDTTYGSTKNASPSPVSGTTDTAVSAILDGLSPGSTTYHYRVKATNSVGTTNGADKTFTTNAAAPSATTDTADYITATGVVLFGFVNPKGTVTEVEFEYGKTTEYGSKITAGNSPLNFLLTINQITYAILDGLTPNTTYHFRVVAKNSVDTTYGEDATFTTEILSIPPWLMLLLD